MHMAYLSMLGLFSCLSINLMLHCGLGIAGIAATPERTPSAIKAFTGFLSLLILWLFFSYVLRPLALGFYEYILCIPMASLIYKGLEHLIYVLMLKGKNLREEPFFMRDGLLGAVLIVMLSLSSNFIDALVLSLGASLGILLVIVIMREISRRAKMERVPVFLQGIPLFIISLGLLSLIFTSVSLILFRLWAA